jgi:hypothetical protein
MANFALGKGSIDAAKIGAKYDMYSSILNSGANALGSFMGGKPPIGGGSGGGGTSSYGGYNSLNLNNPFSTDWNKP